MTFEDSLSGLIKTEISVETKMVKVESQIYRQMCPRFDFLKTSQPQYMDKFISRLSTFSSFGQKGVSEHLLEECPCLKKG